MSPGFGPKSYWDQRFASEEFVYGKQPNDFLRQQAAGLAAGQALCLAEGEGRNAVFLAELGHQVCVQDISPIGLGKAKALAQQKGVSITILCCDLAALDLKPTSLDLIAAIWMHVEPELRARVFEQAVEALRQGAPTDRGLSPPAAELQQRRPNTEGALNRGSPAAAGACRPRTADPARNRAHHLRRQRPSGAQRGGAIFRPQTVAVATKKPYSFVTLIPWGCSSIPVRQRGLERCQESDEHPPSRPQAGHQTAGPAPSPSAAGPPATRRRLIHPAPAQPGLFFALKLAQLPRRARLSRRRRGSWSSGGARSLRWITFGLLNR